MQHLDFSLEMANQVKFYAIDFKSCYLNQSNSLKLHTL